MLSFLFILVRFKFGTVTTGEFRDHFLSFFTSFAQAEIDAVEASVANAAAAAAAASKKSQSRRNKKKGKPTPDTAAAGAPTAAQQQRIDDMKALSGAVQQLPWDDLFLSEGVPPFCPDFANSLSKHAESLAFTWIAYASSGNKSHITDPAVADFQVMDALATI